MYYLHEMKKVSLACAWINVSNEIEIADMTWSTYKLFLATRYITDYTLLTFSEMNTTSL